MDVTLNLRVDEYANRVLGVIKEKFGLRDKSEALKKFAEMYGEDFVEKEVREEVVNDIIESCERHVKKYGFRKMSAKELDVLCDVR